MDYSFNGRLNIDSLLVIRFACDLAVDEFRCTQSYLDGIGAYICEYVSSKRGAFTLQSLQTRNLFKDFNSNDKYYFMIK